MQNDHKIFEDEVRRIARALWPRAATSGALIVDGRERDGIFDDGEIVHIIEATTSRKLQKIADDLEKSAKLVGTIRRENPEKLLKIWMITQDEPTADQRGAVPEARKRAKCPIEICSYKTFSSKLIDTPRYLELRSNYPFGSVRNPADENDTNVPKEEYIKLELIDKKNNSTFNSVSLIELIRSDSGGHIVITGDFGSGKSMTLREVFYELREMHLKNEIIRFPVYINLRDHFGQSDPSEALMRHGRLIGMPDPSQLVASWRAGQTILFLDGFDEVSSIPLVRGLDKIKQARRQAVSLVKFFLSQSPKRSKIIVSGREHYFDSGDELISSLGLEENDIILSIGEFTDDQIRQFLEKRGINEFIPNWLPARPLLLGYLAVRGVVGSQSALSDQFSPEEGWDYILDRVAREKPTKSMQF